MVEKYKGYTIHIDKEKSLGGWANTYYHIERDSDGFMPIDDFTSGYEDPEVILKMLKEKIDEEIRADGEDKEENRNENND